jgi:subtilase family serine protease
MEELRRVFHEEIYNRSHPRHRQFLTSDEVKKTLAVSEECVESVLSYARTAAPAARLEVGPHSDYIHIEASITEIEAIFDVSMAKFEHSHDRLLGVTLLRSESKPKRTLPSCVVAVHRLHTDFFPKTSVEGPYSWPGMTITPDVIRSAYNFTDINGTPNSFSG